MKFIKIHDQDMVAVALTNLSAGEIVSSDNKEIILLEDIPNAHKIALIDITKGEQIIKYGNSIGTATSNIKAGQWVHDHNVETNANKRKEYTYHFNSDSIFPGTTTETFMGYERADGNAGVRNHLAIIPTVFCANGPLNRIADLARAKYQETSNFDGVLAFNHPNGCAQTGEDLDMTVKIISGIIKSSNFGGVLVVSLGCEVNDVLHLKKFLGDYDESKVKFLVLQDVDDEFSEGLVLCDELYKEIEKDIRQPLNFDKLHIALNCGGSDGLSGITANKIVGGIAEIFVKKGATVNMTEVPEMFGAEHLLMNRAVNKEVFQDTVNMINDYIDYFERYGERVSDNPSQGNKAGGLSTLEEKSLGCIQKGGQCAIMEVLKHGERATKNGYILISGPGNDIIGITGQIVAGAVLTIFTTGRGTPAGYAGPLFKLSTNSALANKKPGWIDFNAGRLVEGALADDLITELYGSIVDTINGEYLTKNESNGYYQFGIMRDGVNL